MKKIHLTILLLLIIFLISGCMTTTATTPKVRQIALNNKFDKEQAKAALEPGNNTIKGSGVIVRNGGSVVTTAGLEVYLIPVTEYSSEIFLHVFGNAGKNFLDVSERDVEFTNSDPEYAKHQRTTVGNSQGFFTFDKLKDGEYFIYTTIAWKLSPRSIDGADLMERVKVTGGETKEIVLSPYQPQP